MPEEFKFPDEDNKVDAEIDIDTSAETDVEIEIEDDTPEEDRGREPLPANLKEELENDEIDSYDENVKKKFK